jgi:hypothetical protein
LIPALRENLEKLENSELRRIFLLAVTFWALGGGATFAF